MSPLRQDIFLTVQYRIEESVRRASADGFVAMLKDADGRTGMDAHVGECDGRVSGGQRQRIALARASYRTAPVLILDEATSALDSEAEVAIHDTLGEVMTGRTVIAPALHHRPPGPDPPAGSSSRNPRRVLERGGIYADLWSRQSGGFLGTTGSQERAHVRVPAGAPAALAPVTEEHADRRANRR